MIPAWKFLRFVARVAPVCRSILGVGNSGRSDLRRQFAQEAGDRVPDVSGDVSIAGFRGVLELGLVVDVAVDFVAFRIQFDADHETRFPDAGPGERENHARVVIIIIPCEFQDARTLTDDGGTLRLQHSIAKVVTKASRASETPQPPPTPSGQLIRRRIGICVSFA